MKTSTAARFFILMALGLLAMAALMAVPADNAPGWAPFLIASKVLACTAFFIFHRLHSRWFPPKAKDS